jgi:group I intron endonuclease
MIIYKITNKINKKAYIGQTIMSLKRRWTGHIYKSKKSNTPLHNAIKKYGADNFIIQEIGGANSQSELNYQEWLLIYNHNTLWPNGYNMMEGGGSKGKKSECSRKKMSKSQKMAAKRNIRYNVKKVIDINTGKIYGSASEVGRLFKIKNIHCILNGKRVNDTTFRYLEKQECIKKRERKHSKKIINTLTGKSYKSIKQCWLNNKGNYSYSYFKSMINGTTKNKTIFKMMDNHG